MSGFRIALFRNDGSTASVADAALPDLNSANEPGIAFNAFRTLQMPNDHALQGKTSSNPVYTNDMVYWAVHDQPAPGIVDRRGVISVWRLDSHFATAGVDRIEDFRPLSPYYRPAVVVDGKIVTVCCSTGLALSVYQKSADGSWAEVSVQAPRLHRPKPTLLYEEARSLVMLAGSSFHDSIRYTYRFVSQPTDGSPLLIDMMKTTNLVNLRNERTLGWYRSTHETHIAGETHAYTITHAEDGESHKLFFFDFGADGSFIYCRWIHLLNDGFIHGEKNERHEAERDGSSDNYKYGSSDGYYAVGSNGMHLEIAKGAPGTGDVPSCGPSSRQIMAFTWLVNEPDETGGEMQVQNLLLMWHTDLGYAAIAGKLDKDGGIPRDWQWKNIKVSKRGADAPAKSYDLYGVLVEKDFV